MAIRYPMKNKRETAPPLDRFLRGARRTIEGLCSTDRRPRRLRWDGVQWDGRRQPGEDRVAADAQTAFLFPLLSTRASRS